MPPCAVKTCAVRPVFARVAGELRAADPSNVQGPVKQNASPGGQSEAPRPRWKPGQEQQPGPENQDSQHMLKQPKVASQAAWYRMENEPKSKNGKKLAKKKKMALSPKQGKNGPKMAKMGFGVIFLFFRHFWADCQTSPIL